MDKSPLLLQLLIIIGTARGLGLLLRWLGQPPVIGEMAAGIVLGPVVFGALAPQWHAEIFSPASLPPLSSLSQLGLVLFMFIVGAELRLPSGVGSHLRASSLVGGLAVIVPMALGLIVAVLSHDTLAPAGIGFWPYALFMAASMSITAFPVMARILKERRMTHSVIGRLSLTSAAVADVFAWIMLAVVVVMVSSHGNWNTLVRMLLGVLALVVIVFWPLRLLMKALLQRYAADGRPGVPVFACLLIGTFACAYATTMLDVHPVFGAFLFGACLPRDDRLLASLIERVEFLAVGLLMPTFFALAGLNTTASAFVGSSLGFTLLILAAAVAGKLIGGAWGARLTGMSWRPALAVGALMNARGLMELIVIKVGFDAGVIGRDMFTMLLVMAIVTTAMTGPLLTLFARNHPAAMPDGVPAGLR